MSSKALPAGLETALATASSFECVRVDPTLSGIQLRRTDVIVVPTSAILFAFVSEQEPKLVSGGLADKPTVLVVAQSRGGPIRAMDRFDVVWVEPCEDMVALAKRITSRAGGMLVSKGVARRRSDTGSPARPQVAPPPKPRELGPVSLATVPKKSSLPSLLPEEKPLEPGRSSLCSAAADTPPSAANGRPSKGPRGLPSSRPALRPARATTRAGYGLELGRLEPPTRHAQPTLPEVNLKDASVRPVSPIRSIMPKALHIEGSRWLLLDDDVARAHAVAKALESAGAEVLLSGTHPVEAQISSFRQFGAAGALIEETNLEAIGTLLQRIQTDPWLHPIGLIPICWQQLYDPDSQRVELEALKLRVLPHWQLEHDQLEALLHGQTVGVAQLGIAKLLRVSLRRDWHGELKLDSGGVQYRLVVARARLWSLRIDEQERIGSVAAALPCLLAIEQGTMSWEERTSELATGALGVSLDVLIGNLPANTVSVSAPPQPKAPPVPDEIRPAEFASQLERQQRATIDTGTRPAERWSVVAAALGRVYLSAQNRWSAWGHRQRYAVSIGLAAAITLPLLAMGRQGRQVLATVAAASASAVPLALDVPREPRTVTGGLELVHAPDQAESLADRSSKAPSQGCERWNQASSAKLGERMAAGWAKVQAKTEWHAARRAIQIGDWDKAERLLCLSAILDPTGPGPVDLVGLFLSRGLPEPADHWGTWAVAHQPRNSKAIQMLADVRIQQGRTDEAKGLLHQSMNVSADDKQVLKQVARKYTQVAYQAFRARDPYQARRLFLRAHALDSDYALATAGLSEVELQTGDPDRALQWAQTAATLDPNCFEAQLNLGDARAKHGEAAAAKQAWLEALRLQPASIAIRRRLGL